MLRQALGRTRLCHRRSPRSSRAMSTPYQWQAACSSADESQKRVFPAAEKNKGPILQVLQQRLPGTGTVLEVASGTGQHISHFAAHLPPTLVWQPSDLTPDLFPSIRAHCSSLSNVRDPVVLDAAASIWPVEGPFEAVVVANLTHIAPWDVTLGLIAGASRLLQPQGLLCIYGPFKLDGHVTTQSNLEFHNHLVSSNPAWGYRDTAEVTKQAAAKGLKLLDIAAMPANNFMLVYQKESSTAGAG